MLIILSGGNNKRKSSLSDLLLSSVKCAFKRFV